MSRGMREHVGGTCGCPIERSCRKANQILESIRMAPASERTQFVVCGSDMRTYRSKYHVECASRFNHCKFNQ